MIAVTWRVFSKNFKIIRQIESRYFVKTHGIIPSFDPSSAAAPLKTFNISDECWEKRVDEPMPYDETRFYGSLEKPGDEDLNEVSRQMITIARGAGKSSELDCFLRQNLQKTAEVFFFNTQSNLS